MGAEGTFFFILLLMAVSFSWAIIVFFATQALEEIDSKLYQWEVGVGYKLLLSHENFTDKGNEHRKSLIISILFFVVSILSIFAIKFILFSD